MPGAVSVSRYLVIKNDEAIIRGDSVAIDAATTPSDCI
jgi:hypothetical protein